VGLVEVAELWCVAWVLPHLVMHHGFRTALSVRTVKQHACQSDEQGCSLQ
jgi:hypothetical protein